VRVNELPEQARRVRSHKALEPFRQSAAQEVSQYWQSQVVFHVQANVAAQAIEMKKRDLLTKVVLHVISARVSLDEFSRRLRLGQGIGQEERRGFLTLPCHDQLPHGP
jgi:hypothetical protein